MWAIRLLNGTQPGQVYALKQGPNTVGRGPACDIRVANSGVSKEHARIFVTEDKVIISDLNSRNGTFVNGVRIQNQKLSIGDKIALHDSLFDVLHVPVSNLVPTHGITGHRVESHDYRAGQPPLFDGNAAYDSAALQAMHAHGIPQENPYATPQIGTAESLPEAHGFTPPNSIKDLIGNFKSYIDNVAMPGVYHVAQMMEFRWALAALLAVFVVITTLAATVPMIANTKVSIQTESQRRALTITRNLAQMNRRYVIENLHSSVSTRMAELEDGVSVAAIISTKDGQVIAPVGKAGNYLDKPFIHKARRENREMVAQIDDSTVGAAVPIEAYNAELQTQQVVAHAVVLYDMGNLAMNMAQTISFFVKILGLIAIIASILFFFLYKIVEHPIHALNKELDDALREGHDDVRTVYEFPALERLAANISSALSRIGGPSGAPMGGGVSTNQREAEADNLLQMMPTAALAINGVDNNIISSNQSFDRLVGGGVDLRGRSISEIPDVSLQENIRDLLESMRASPHQIALSEIPFFGKTFEISGQAVMGTSEPAYYIISLQELDIEGGH